MFLRRLLEIPVSSFSNNHLLKINNWAKLNDTRVMSRFVMLNNLQNISIFRPNPYFPETKILFIKNCDDSIKDFLYQHNFPVLDRIYTSNNTNFSLEHHILKNLEVKVYSPTKCSKNIKFISKEDLEEMLKEYDVITEV